MIKGKGFYIWELYAQEVLAPVVLANKLAEEGFSHVIIKVADGPYLFNVRNGADLVVPYLDTLRERGLAVWGFQFVYGNDPAGEARMGIRRSQELGLDGLVIDGEGQYYHKALAAERYMSDLRAGLGSSFPLALSSFRWPTVHAPFPFEQFMNSCDIAMPQVYWMGNWDSAGELRRCVNEYRARWKKPIIPTGAAFQERGWRAQPAEIVAFFEEVKRQDLPGCNFWELANSIRYGLYDTVASLEWSDQPVPEPEPEPKPEPGPQVITIQNPRSDRLNLRSAPAVSAETFRGQLHNGTQVEVLEEKQVGQDVWLRVKVEGWIAKRVGGRSYLEGV